MKSFQDYLKKFKNIQISILQFLDEEYNIEENYQNLIKLLEDLKIREDRHEVQTILYLILKISNNHHRTNNFFHKIELLLTNFKDEIQKNYSQFEIFDIFKNNKRILLFLVKEGVLTIDEEIANVMKNDKYSKLYYFYYFFNEIKSFTQNQELIQRLTDEMPDRYEEKRLDGENCNEICEIIRKDSVEQFSSYVKEKSVSFDSKIKPSIFETNGFLLKRDPDLIEYSAFHGSLNIIKYLCSNNVPLKPSMWIYAIHSGKFELIQFLASEKVAFEDLSYEVYLKESVKCHHNQMASYFQKKFLNDQTEYDNFLVDNFNCNYVSYGFHFYNFSYLPNEIDSKLAFLYSCQYDYYIIVELLLKNKQLNTDLKLLLSNLRINIASNCFKGCRKLRKIIIPPPVSEIGVNSFEKCTSLVDITLPPTIESIEDYAFDGCYSLVQITIPPSVKTIGNSTFRGCSSLVQITFPSSVKTVGAHCFNDCSSLREAVFPSTLTSIGEGAFFGCKSLTKITIPFALNIKNCGIGTNVTVSAS